MQQIGIGYHPDEPKPFIVYQNDDIQEIWEMNEAAIVALGILHTVSAAKEQMILVETLKEMGINDKNVKLILSKLNVKRVEILSKLGEKADE